MECINKCRGDFHHSIGKILQVKWGDVIGDINKQKDLHEYIETILLQYPTLEEFSKELDKKVDKIEGYGLSKNDFTDVLKALYDEAVINTHTHNNKAVLDEIEGFKTINGESIIGEGDIDIKVEGVEEAPKDGKKYARKDGEWSEVEGGSDKPEGGWKKEDLSEDVQASLDKATEWETDKADYITASEISEQYQIKGDYIEQQYALDTFQPKGDYITQVKTINGEDIVGEGDIEIGDKGYTFRLGNYSDNPRKVFLDITKEEVDKLVANNIKSFLCNYNKYAITVAGVNNNDTSKIGVLYTYYGNFVTNNTSYWDLTYNETEGCYEGLFADSRNGQFISTTFADGRYIQKSGVKTINGDSIVGEGDIEINVPTKTSDLTNDSNFTTMEDVEALVTPLTPNIIKYGDLNITDGQLSNFGATNYAQFPFLVDLSDKAFEITMQITTSNDVTNQQNILDSQDGLAFAIRNGQFVLAISNNGTQWAFEAVGGTVSANTTYLIKLSWDKAIYNVIYSVDNGITWTDAISQNSDLSPYPRTMLIGKDISGEYFFKGTINLNKCTLSINGQYVWDGMTDAGLLTRLDTSLSNIDANGETYLNGLIDSKIGDIDNALKLIIGD